MTGEIPQISFEEFVNTKKFQADTDNYLLREIAGESVLISVGVNTQNSNRMFSLNDTCNYLWHAFDTPKTIRQVVDESLEIYDATEETLLNDIFAFVRDYFLFGLLREKE